MLIDRRDVILSAATAAAIAPFGSATARPLSPIHKMKNVREIIGGDGEIGDVLARLANDRWSAWIPSGRYTLSGEVDQGNMFIYAANDASIEGVGTGSAMLRSRGEFVALPSIRQDSNAGEWLLAFQTPHGLLPGDWVIIYNPADYSWHSSRPYYRAGEWCRVASVSPMSVILSQPLKADYAAIDVQMFRVLPRRPAIIGGMWNCGGRELVRYTACTGLLVNVERVDAASNTAIYIDRCVEAEIGCRFGRNVGVGLDDYLICVGNSQSVRVKGDRLYSRRHPVAIGGGDVICGVPCRDCVVQGITLENDISSNVMCADIHGNSEACAYVQCLVFGGISLGGASPAFRNCVVYARRDGAAAEATELVGGTIDLTGIEITTDAVNVGGGRGIIDIGTQNGAFNAGTRMAVSLTINDFSINAPQLAQDGAIIRIRNTGSNAQLNVRINRGKLKLGKPVQFLRTELVSGRDQGGVIVIKDVRGLPQQSKLHYAVSGPIASSSASFSRLTDLSA